MSTPTYHLTVHMSGGRKAPHTFHTYKSARHYAKAQCNNANVERITLTGPGLDAVLFQRG